MPQDVNLKDALDMFTSGVQDLQFHRALSAANDQVNQIKSSEMDEQQKRSSLQGVSNNLVMQMAGMRIPDTTIASVQGAIAPKQFANPNDMYMYGVQTGNQQLQDQAKQGQQFEMYPKMEEIKAGKQIANAYRQAAFGEKQDVATDKMLKGYGDDLDAAKATSRSAFGQWASMDQRGERLNAIMGDPSRWKNLTAPELQLVVDGVGQMSKGGVVTAEENKNLMPWTLAIKKAQLQSAATNQPVAMDLSGFAGLYNNITQREGAAAKSGMLDAITNKIQKSAYIANRPGAMAQFQRTTSSALGQVGLNVNPDTISVDKRGNVTIPELKPFQDAASQAPGMVKQALQDAQTDSPKASQAKAFLNAYGVTPDMPLAQAIRHVQSHIKAKVFE